MESSGVLPPAGGGAREPPPRDLGAPTRAPTGRTSPQREPLAPPECVDRAFLRFLALRSEEEDEDVPEPEEEEEEEEREEERERARFLLFLAFFSFRSAVRAFSSAAHAFSLIVVSRAFIAGPVMTLCKVG